MMRRSKSCTECCIPSMHAALVKASRTKSGTWRCECQVHNVRSPELKNCCRSSGLKSHVKEWELSVENSDGSWKNFWFFFTVCGFGQAVGSLCLCLGASSAGSLLWYCSSISCGLGFLLPMTTARVKPSECRKIICSCSEKHFSARWRTTSDRSRNRRG